MTRSGCSLLAMTLLLGSVLPVAAQYQTCIDNAVIACFDGCNDPNNFQECIIGCATGANNNMQNCYDQCYNDPLCLEKCKGSVRAISTCAFVTGMITSTSGAPVLNRSTGYWQQTVRITNTTQSDTWHDVALVLDSLTPGWKLQNGDGVTNELPPTGSPYKTIGKLLPGQSTTVTLQFTRITQLQFGYITRVVVSQSR